MLPGETIWLGVLSGSRETFWDHRGAAVAQVCLDRCSDWANGHYCLYCTIQMTPVGRVCSLDSHRQVAVKDAWGHCTNNSKPYWNPNLTRIKKHLKYLLLSAADVKLGSPSLKLRTKFLRKFGPWQQHLKTHTHAQIPAYKHQHNYLLNLCPINKHRHSLCPLTPIPLNPRCSQRDRARVTKTKSKWCVKYGWDSLLGEGFVFPGTQADWGI